MECSPVDGIGGQGWRSTSPRRNVVRKLIYSMAVSLDGYIVGPDGRHDWSAPDEELHLFHNEQSKELGGHLMGRRLYEDMLPWEIAQQHGDTRTEFAEVWSAIPKVVFSTTLTAVQGNARLARGTVAEEVATLRAQTGKDISVGGAGLAASMIRLGLIDEYRLFVNPVLVGGGVPFFPGLEQAVTLELLETRTFGSRVVYIRYGRAVGARAAA
jgi:dihydrofolate reductase